MRLNAITLGLLPAVPLALASAHAAGPDAHRRHHARSVQLDQRELAGQGFSNTIAQPMTASSAGNAVPSSSSSAVSSSTTSSAAVSSISSAAPTTSSAAESSVAPTTAAASSDIVESSAAVVSSATTTSSVAPVVVVPSSSSVMPSSSITTTTTSSIAGPSTLASVPVLSSVTSFVKVTVSASTARSSSSAVASSSANQDNASTSSGGLSKAAIIAIAVVAGVLGLAALGWTLFRKFKLKPRSKFDDKMRPISFGPHGVADDEFFEKTLQRTASHSSADRQRQAYASELDNPNLVAGIPEHDFTASGGGIPHSQVYDAYHQDPYYHAEAYEYDPTQQQNAYAPGAYAGHNQAYGAPLMHHQQHQQHDDYPSQDMPLQDGYADLQRGNSQGSGSGHGHGYSHPVSASAHGHGHGSAHGHGGSMHDHAPPQQLFSGEFPSPENYLGRPTGGSDGPYAQAAQYRGL